MGKKKIFTSDAWENFIAGIAALKDKIDGKADEHAHPYLSSDTKYAGSSTAGGSATSAVKLDTASAGSATNPVYFADGKPVKTTYTLGASVPSGAKFTDTVYTLPVATDSVLGGVKSGGDVTISSTGAITVNDDSHNHTIANIDDLQGTLDSINEEYETKTDASAKLTEAKTYTDTVAAGKADADHNHDAKYDAKGAAVTAESNAKAYADAAADAVKDDLLNGAGTAYDTLKELGDLIDDNADAIDVLETVAAGKADANHTHNYAGSSSAGGSATSAVKLTITRYIDGVSFNGAANVTRYATCSTAAGTVAKTASVTAGTFSLITGARATVKFTYANTVASPTLNIGSTGAKAIYWHGAALPSSQYWAAGAVLDFVYNGTQWDLIGVGDTNHNHTVSHTPAGTVASTSVTPAGTVSQPTFTGTAASHSHTFTGTAASHNHTFTGTEATIATDFTPAGTVTSTFTGTAASHNHTFTGSAVTSGAPSATATVASSAHTHEYTPAGTVSKPTFTGSAVTSGTPSGTTSVYSITGVGSVPSLTASVSNRCLTLTFSAGSVPTRSSVTLPSTSHTHSVTAAGAVSQPTFTGTEASTTSITGTTSVAKSDHTHSVTPAGTVANKSVTPAGTISSTFTGTEAEIAVDYTPAGTVANKSVTPAGTISETSITPAGTVSKPTFTGTAATHNHTFTGTAATLTTSSSN